ncbi:MAG: aconitase X catalytic domain-containing protein [Candidatus Diapherotrites archaeon]|nr:aconitase X catalytic domain-containing protein [Candidatus Diapherotrites archaeon]
MNLTKEEQKMLDGEYGEGVQKAMEIIVALGKIYGAENLVEVASVQVAGVSYKNLGDAGIEFLEEWASKGAKVKVPTTLNPAGMDLDDWKSIGFAEEFADKQLEVIKAFSKMGIPPTCTCTPYLAGNIPKFGDHIAWAESSAVSFANSVIGARTNREGGPSAIAAAVTGRTANFGYHLDENRVATFKIIVEADMKDTSDFGALGYWTGKQLRNKVPFFVGIKHATTDCLKSLGAASAASGGIALYHIENITAEARAKAMLSDDHETVTFTDKEKRDVFEAIGFSESEIDLVVFGCPHASLEEVRTIAERVKGKKLKAMLWITTSKQVKSMAERMGLVKDIEDAGGYIIADMCAVVAPVKSFGFKNIAVNSGKYAWYLPNQGFNVRFGSTEKCIEAAITGRWEP